MDTSKDGDSLDGGDDLDPSQWDRREFLRRAAAAGVIVVPGSVLAACATSGGGSKSDDKPKGINTGGAKSSSADSSAPSGSKAPSGGGAAATNPLGVNPDKPLDVFIFKGGYGDQYAKDAETMYKKEFPNVSPKHTGTQQLAQKLQTRFVNKTPPDVIDNSGAGNLDVATLIAHNQITDLSALFNAPAFDTPGKTVEETLLPGVKATGEYSGKPYILNYVYTVDAIWHSDKLFKARGWEYPQTWDDMMTLCAEIKKAGIAPWAYQGKYPQYILSPILQMAAKNGGADVLKNIDNLESGAWKADPVVSAAAAFHQLVDKGYLMKGTQGLTHTQSQTYWAQGKAVFIPCGSWLENELGTATPKGFDMVINPVPALAKSDKMPFPTVRATAGEGFIVPADAKNPNGGAEFLRIMLSKKASANFSKITHSQTVLSGYADNLNFSTAFSSARDVSAAAGKNTLNWQFGGWYAKLETAVENATGQLMLGKSSPEKWASACQKAADETKKDPSIKKYKR
jgi:N-acetylglucosamine transport system substrate-binding protein